MNILLVDDDTGVLKISSKIIRKYNHNVVTATDGKTALDIFSADPLSFDMILSDVVMPVMDGFTLLERARQYNSDIPFVIMTAFGDTAMVIKSIKKGATDFISKPYEKKELASVLSRIESMLNSRLTMESAIPFINTYIKIAIPSRTELISGFVEYLQILAKPYCTAYGINIGEIGISLSEALTNAVVHGNLEISSSVKYSSWEEFESVVRVREADPLYSEKEVTLFFQTIDVDLGPTGGSVAGHSRKIRALQWDITDSGKGFDHMDIERGVYVKEKLLPSGRGVFIIRTFMDEVLWKSGGNTIRMIKYLEK